MMYVINWLIVPVKVRMQDHTHWMISALAGDLNLE